MTIKRGSLYLAALDPVIGNEITKTRPVFVIYKDKANEFWNRDGIAGNL